MSLGNTSNEASPSTSVINVQKPQEQRPPNERQKRRRSGDIENQNQPQNKKGRALVSKDALQVYKQLWNTSTKINKLEHQQEFLNKCLDKKVIPLGLQLKIQPGIGKTDIAFIDKWKSTLGQCSFGLMSLLVDYLGGQIADLEVTKSKFQKEVDKTSRQDQKEIEQAILACQHKVKSVEQERLNNKFKNKASKGPIQTSSTSTRQETSTRLEASTRPETTTILETSKRHELPERQGLATTTSGPTTIPDKEQSRDNPVTTQRHSNQNDLIIFNKEFEDYLSKLVINLSDLTLSAAAKSALQKGLSFVPTQLDHDMLQIYSDFKTFYRRVRLKHHFFDDSIDDNVQTTPPLNFQDNLARKFRQKSNWIPSKGKDAFVDAFIEATTLGLLTSKPRKWVKQNLTKTERRAIEDLSKNKNIVIKKADKGSAIVILNAVNYNQMALTQLMDERFYVETSTNLTTFHTLKINRTLLSLLSKNEINQDIYNFLQVEEPRTPQFYLLPKIHKTFVNGSPPEEKLLNGFPLKPFLYLRFIDDIFIIWTHGKESLNKFIQHMNSQHRTIKFTAEVSEEQVVFLDTIVKFRKTLGTVEVELYTKPTDTHSYLHYDSEHPIPCKKAGPYGQFLRVKRNCTNDADFQRHSASLLKYYKFRGYNETLLNASLKKAEAKDRKALLNPVKKDTKKMTRIPLVLSYTKASPNLREIIDTTWPLLHIKETTKQIFSEQPLFAYKRNKNLKDILVRAAFQYPPITPGTSGISTLNKLTKCSNEECSYCPWINFRRSFTSTFTERKYRKNYIGDCNTPNIIYMITCKSCKQQYVGKSKRPFKARLGEHLRYVKNKSTEPTGKHFNQTGHNIHHMSFEIIEVLWNDPNDNTSDVLRSKREDYWILQLRALKPIGINSLETSKFHYLGKAKQDRKNRRNYFLGCINNTDYTICSHRKKNKVEENTIMENLEFGPGYENRVKLTNKRSAGEYCLTIINVSSQDEGFYRCYTENQNSILQFNLSIEAAPDDLVILNRTTDKIITETEGQMLNLTCQAIGGNTKGKIYWRNVSDFEPHFTEVDAWPFAYLHFAADYKHNKMNLSCVVEHDMLSAQMVASVVLNIRYKPKITFSRYLVGDIEEGQDMKLECLDESNPPKTNLTWRKDGIILSYDSIYTKSNMKTNDSGNYSCIVINSLGEELQDIIILVIKGNDTHINGKII
ncbi:unnamed protein product [Mytilus edulis]|uniref:Uncharacterized protein n=1 Tax=Mytilus edulis TaxID=6550 RepID=A0A8S3SDH8_MYTED|nr:unnamed protein product [Mytilus edulis]